MLNLGRSGRKRAGQRDEVGKDRMTAGGHPAPDGEASRRRDADALRVLTFSSLYPNDAQPSHGIFVENRLRRLVANGAVMSRVVAPVPWLPKALGAVARYAPFAQAPRREIRHGVEVHHPRYPVLPKVGMTLAPAFLAGAMLPVLKRLDTAEPFELIDAHYFYPDGVAAVLLGAWLAKPVVVTARGTDINLIPRHPAPRAMIRWAARRAAGIVAVSQALKDAMVDLGVPDERVTVLRNGVDLDTFRPTDRDATRRALGIGGRVLLSVGHLIPRKGHDFVIAALPSLPETTLLIAGEGPERAALEEKARSLGVAARVRFLGRIDHDRLAPIYGAADALVLASSREGWANVLLEAMACGTPAVASAVWGNPEVVARPEAGVLMTSLDAAGVAEAVSRLFGTMPDRAATRRYAEGFSWEATTDGQIRLFRDILARRAMAPSLAAAC
jgi:glycosyltransferase involved in cell wall biosynthesis